MSFLVPSNFRQLPPVWEISQPFNIDSTGAVAFDLDPYRWAMNHILAILLTNPGERVMRPTYGAGVYGFVWENDNPLEEQALITTINNQLATYEPNIIVNDIEFLPEPQYSGIVTLQIHFTVGSSPTIQTFTVNLSGSSVEVNA